MKKVLITGASSGIGCSLAEIYAQNSYDLVLVARREEKLVFLKNLFEKKYGIKVIIEVMDLTVKTNLNTLAEKHSDSDILINNAGFGKFARFSDYDLDIDENMVTLSILTPVILTKLFLKTMKKGSKIINIASTAGFQPVPFMATYSASKSFLVDFTLAIQKENKDIDIILYCPGETQTEFQNVANRPKSSLLRGKIPEAYEVANYLFEEVKRSKNFIIYGKYNKILIFIQRFFNKNLISNLIYKINIKLGGKNVSN